MSQPTNNPIATLSHFLPFHGSNVMVYSYNNELFVPAKAITEIIGIDWYNVRRSVQADDNQKLYGTITLTTPIIDNFKGDIIEKTHKNHLKNTESDDLNPHKPQTIDILCIRFDRVIMFMTKVNTGKMRSAGNIDGADYLLELQQEWADALHSYETQGIAIKDAETKRLESLFNMYRKADDKKHRELLARRIDQALGYRRPNDDDQNDMFS